MRKRTFDFQDDEIESESYCLSNNSQTQSLHSGNSGRVSDISSKKNEKNGTKLHSTKSDSSDAMKKGSNRRLDHHLYRFRHDCNSATDDNYCHIYAA